MKKFLALTLFLTMLCTCALADTSLSNCAIANGNVQAVHYVDITAPYSGVVSAFDIAMGDSVKAGDELFRMMTTTIYATEDGTVAAVFGTAGDDASALSARYGAVTVVEPAQQLRLNASTAGAYNDEDNKRLHVGETLYFRSNGTDKEEGSGRVISVSGSSYVVDVLEGDFKVGETMTLYRNDRYGTKDNVGKGSIVRRDALSAQGMGRIAEILAVKGQQVKAGDALFTLMSSDADASAKPSVTIADDGVVGQVAVVAGQQVWKGQVLARIYLTKEVEVVADVDEIDLADLKVGDTLKITLDTDADMIINGKVTEISALGITKQNAAYYTVHVSIPADNAMLGGSASVYIPRK